MCINTASGGGTVARDLSAHFCSESVNWVQTGLALRLLADKHREVVMTIMRCRGRGHVHWNFAHPPVDVIVANHDSARWVDRASESRR